MLTIDPFTKPPNVDMTLPGSKSITNRALVVAALAEGRSTLRKALFSEDTLAMVDSLRLLGVEIEAVQSEETLIVNGCAGKPQSDGSPLWVRQSGTTARFIMPIAALTRGEVTIDGDEQIRTRPHNELFDALEHIGIGITYQEGEGSLPVAINGEKIHSASVDVSTSLSSQYLSAILLAAPCMPDDMTITATGDMVSAPYIAMTIDIMRSFGADVEEINGNQFLIRANGYSAKDYEVETDASTASYFFAAAAISGGRVKIAGLGQHSIQGDLGFVDLLEEMGAKVHKDKNTVEVIGPKQLKGIETSMKSISDTSLTLAAIAPLTQGTVTVSGIGFIEHKESDRVNAVVAELQKLGVRADNHGDGFTVQSGEPASGVIETYDDHRIAMAFTVLGLVSDGIAINNSECVSKTFPEFFEYIDQLRLEGDKDLRILAIDGPAGSGKTSLAKRVASEIGLEYLDTGAMYRSVAAMALRSSVDPEDKEAVVSVANNIHIDFENETVLVNGENLTEVIRGPEVNAVVSHVAANPGVRAVLRRTQRSWARKRGGGILEGRDIGTVVFPKATLKVYVTATPEERARRRSLESGRPVEEILQEITGRDQIDSSRDDSPLSVSDEALVVDTTGKTLDEVANEIIEAFHG